MPVIAISGRDARAGAGDRRERFRGAVLASVLASPGIRKSEPGPRPADLVRLAFTHYSTASWRNGDTSTVRPSEVWKSTSPRGSKLLRRRAAPGRRHALAQLRDLQAGRGRDPSRGLSMTGCLQRKEETLWPAWSCLIACGVDRARRDGAADKRKLIAARARAAIRAGEVPGRAHYFG